jgi:hypothetical protein
MTLTVLLNSIYFVIINIWLLPPSFTEMKLILSQVIQIQWSYVTSVWLLKSLAPLGHIIYLLFLSTRIAHYSGHSLCISSSFPHIPKCGCSSGFSPVPALCFFLTVLSSGLIIDALNVNYLSSLDEWLLNLDLYLWLHSNHQICISIWKCTSHLKLNISQWNSSLFIKNRFP